MIIVRVLGGIGNQMFQYALGRKIAYDRGEKLVLDISWYPKPRNDFSDFTFELDKFNTSFTVATDKHIRSAIPGGIKGRDFARSLYQYCPTALQNYANYYLEIQPTKSLPKWVPSQCRKDVPHAYHFEPSILDIQTDAYLDGFWQTEKYFIDIENIIKEELSLSCPNTRRCEALAIILSETNSVGIHVRRGDYTESGSTLPVSYFKCAVSEISSTVVEPHFFVFSDEIEWAKDNISISYPTTYVSNNYTDSAYQDMHLLSLCDHTIISNSTFSWWGAWLGEQATQLIVAPSIWYLNLPTKELDIIPERWKIVPV